MLNDEMVATLVKEVDDMGLIFAGVPRERMLVELYDVRETIRAEMVPMVGEYVGDCIAQAFVFAVARRAAELESAGKGMIQ